VPQRRADRAVRRQAAGTGQLHQPGRRRADLLHRRFGGRPRDYHDQFGCGIGPDGTIGWTGFPSRPDRSRTRSGSRPAPTRP